MRAKLRQTVLDRKGNALGGVSVTVRIPGEVDPIDADMFAALVGGSPIANPLLTDANGDIAFYMDAPQYVDLFVEEGALTRTIPNVPVLAPVAEAPAPPASDLVIRANLTDVYVSNDNTRQESDDLRFPVLANEMWDFTTTIIYSQSGNGTGTIAYRGAALTEIRWTYLNNQILMGVDAPGGDSSGSIGGFSDTNEIPLEGGGGSGKRTMVVYTGFFTAAEDGEFIFAYAKESGADPFRIHPGTRIIAHRLGIVTP